MPFNTNFGATDVPTAYRVPKAGAAGVIARGWLQEMLGATGVDGESGAVPTPLIADAANFLRGDGTWAAASVPTTVLTQETAGAGTCLMGGDKTGDARGLEAIDICKIRTGPTQVASGDNALCLGNNNTASADKAVAIGLANSATGTNAVAIGNHCKSYGTSAISIGNYSYAYEDGSISIGASGAYGANSFSVDGYTAPLGHNSIAIKGFTGADTTIALGRQMSCYKPFMTKIGGMQMIGGRNPASPIENTLVGFLNSGAQIGLGLGLTDVTVNTAVARRSMVLAKNCWFYGDQLDVIVCAATAVTVQPTVQLSGGNRTGVSTTFTTGPATGSSISMSVNDSTGFSVGDYVLATFLNSAPSNEALERPSFVAKITGIADANHITVDYIPSNGFANGGDNLHQLDLVEANLMTATITAGLAAKGDRYSFALAPTTGYEVITFRVTIAGAATTLNCRPIVCGKVLEMNADDSTGS